MPPCAGVARTGLPERRMTGVGGEVSRTAEHAAVADFERDPGSGRHCEVGERDGLCLVRLWPAALRGCGMSMTPRWPPISNRTWRRQRQLPRR